MLILALVWTASGHGDSPLGNAYAWIGQPCLLGGCEANASHLVCHCEAYATNRIQQRVLKVMLMKWAKGQLIGSRNKCAHHKKCQFMPSSINGCSPVFIPSLKDSSATHSTSHANSYYRYCCSCPTARFKSLNLMLEFVLQNVTIHTSSLSWGTSTTNDQYVYYVRDNFQELANWPSRPVLTSSCTFHHCASNTQVLGSIHATMIGSHYHACWVWTMCSQNQKPPVIANKGHEPSFAGRNELAKDGMRACKAYARPVSRRASAAECNEPVTQITPGFFCMSSSIFAFCKAGPMDACTHSERLKSASRLQYTRQTWLQDQHSMTAGDALWC